MYKVLCPECRLEHPVKLIKVINVESDQYGRDVAYYKCPVTKQPTSSIVIEDRGE